MNYKHLLFLAIFIANNNYIFSQENNSSSKNRIKILTYSGIATFSFGLAHSVSISMKCINPQYAHLCNELNIYGLSSLILSSSLLLTAGFLKLKESSSKYESEQT